MKVQLLSDTHFEFHRDGGKSFVESMPFETDVLVLAGDIAGPDLLEEALSRFAKRFPHVVAVLGNHDYWDVPQNEVRQIIERVTTQHPNLHVLDRQVVEIEGQRFVGATLWFAESVHAHALAHGWSDFRKIPKFTDWVYQENDLARDFFEREIRPGDIVVSHYLPSWKSVAPMFRGLPTNCYFVTDMEQVIQDRRPAVWCHGHTHGSMDYRIQDTRILCNPFGYAGYEINPDFKDDLIFG